MMLSRWIYIFKKITSLNPLDNLTSILDKIRLRNAQFSFFNPSIFKKSKYPTVWTSEIATYIYIYIYIKRHQFAERRKNCQTYIEKILSFFYLIKVFVSMAALRSATSPPSMSLLLHPLGLLSLSLSLLWIRCCVIARISTDGTCRIVPPHIIEYLR